MKGVKFLGLPSLLYKPSILAAVPSLLRGVETQTDRSVSGSQDSVRTTPPEFKYSLPEALLPV